MCVQVDDEKKEEHGPKRTLSWRLLTKERGQLILPFFLLFLSLLPLYFDTIMELWHVPLQSTLNHLHSYLEDCGNAAKEH